LIWLIGNKGMLGSEVAKALAAAGLEHVGSDRDVDILDPAALRAFAAGKSLSWIVNCAAYTAVDKAEDELELARGLNAGGPKNLAELAAAIGARILHISTDYVFDGTGSRPYVEDDPVAPTGAYGLTKAEGEDLVRRSCAEHVILRTAWLYGKEGNNFVRTMLRLMGSKERIGVVTDQRGTPTYAVDLARAIVSIVASGSPVFGTFQYTNLGEATWYEFALEIQKLGRERGVLARDCEVDALTTAQYPSKVKRPAYSVLSKEKVRRAYDLTIPEWKDALSRFFLEIAP
jgi:dTDP-4-dehydrorhamnose reductase